ncbi:MAG: LamG-like jellyroll fold domain-containing protein [archaeon]|nr:LamG-like jellyroll fold domain-containing protein [archaeon]
MKKILSSVVVCIILLLSLGTTVNAINIYDTLQNILGFVIADTNEDDSCPSPYRGISPDGRCVWSCGYGTQPDFSNNECVCRERYVETGTDWFGRRVCSEENVQCTNPVVLGLGQACTYTSSSNNQYYITYKTWVSQNKPAIEINGVTYTKEVGSLVPFEEPEIKIEYLSNEDTPKLTLSFLTEKQDRCTDSDSGENYRVKGSVINILSGETDTDHCKSGGGVSGKEVKEGPVLAEYFCAGDKTYVSEYKCPNGCRDGICVEETQSGYDSCGNGIGWSQPKSSAEECGWPPGDKGYIKDCCCCYLTSHVHDLSDTFNANSRVEIEYMPGFTKGCTSTMNVYSSEDGKTWSLFYTAEVTQETWSPKTTYKRTLTVPGNFRYIKIYIPECYNDYSSAKVLDGEDECTHGEERKYTCPDSTQVYWCECTTSGTWTCIDSPESQCATGKLNLIAYWKFDAGSGSVAKDSSGNENHGTLRGAEWVDGKEGGGLKIVDTNIVNYIPDSFDDDVSTLLAVECWVYWFGKHPDTYSSNSYVLDARYHSRGGFILYLRPNGSVVFSLRGPSGSQVVESKSVVPINEWTHIKGVFDYGPRTLSVYMNREIDHSVDASFSYYDTKSSAAIGNNRWSPGDHQYAPFNGIIDELKISAITTVGTDSKCVDTDGGKNYYVKGHITGLEVDSTTVFTSYDYCSLNSTEYQTGYNLVELYCKGDYVSADFYTCPNGCRDGACIKDDSNYMEGDADLNGCVSLEDSDLIQSYLVGSETLTSNQLKCADTTDDGAVSLKDSTAIKMWLEHSSYLLWQSPADDNMAKPVACQSSITVISPNGGEEWMIGKMHKTQWVSSKGIEKVNIAYYDARQEDYTYIYKNIPTASGATYESEWIVSQVNSGENVFRIRVEDANNPSIFDESDNYFSIVDKVTCTDTDGGKDYYTKGTATGYENSQLVTSTDGCRYDSKTLAEVYCDGANLKVEQYICPNGCEDGACLRYARDCPELTCRLYCKEGFKTDERGCPVCACSEEVARNASKVCSGCTTDSGCVIQGTRLKYKGMLSYCSRGHEVDVQKGEGKSCQNNYECRSNFCSDNVCIDINRKVQKNSDIIQRIMDVLKVLFSI